MKRRGRKRLSALTAVLVTVCLFLASCAESQEAPPGEPGPAPSSTISSAPTSYPETELLAAGDRVLTASRQGTLPEVASVQGSADGARLIVYLEELDNSALLVDEFERVALVPVVLERGSPPRPTR